MNDDLEELKYLRSRLEDTLARGVPCDATFDTRRAEIQSYRITKHVLAKAAPINHAEELEQLLLTSNETEFQQAHEALANKLHEAAITIPSKLNEDYTCFSPEEGREVLSEARIREDVEATLRDPAPAFHAK